MAHAKASRLRSPPDKPRKTTPPAWKMRVVTVYDDEREVVETSVSKCGLQRQSNKGT